VTRSDDPPEVAGFELGEAHFYEAPPLGWSVPYRREEGVATVYVYPGAKAGDQAECLPQEFRTAVAELSESAIQRGFEVVRLDNSPARIDPTRLAASALHASFLLRGSEESATTSQFSEIILVETTAGFLKVRCTYTPNRPKKTGAAINRLLEALRVML
jgi:hypothetical protein